MTPLDRSGMTGLVSPLGYIVEPDSVPDFRVALGVAVHEKIERMIQDGINWPLSKRSLW